MIKHLFTALQIILLINICHSQLTYKKILSYDNMLTGRDICETIDDGIVMTGSLKNIDSTHSDAFVLKTDAEGTFEWGFSIGTTGTGYDNGLSIAPTDNGGSISIASISGIGAGMSDILVIKVDDQGSVEWSKLLGGALAEGPSSIINCKDGTYAIVASTNSFGLGEHDIMFIKLNGNGDVLESKTFGTSYSEIPLDIVQTPDSGFAICGNLSIGYSGACILKLDKTGDLEWSKSFSTTYFSWGARQVAVTNDSNLVMSADVYYDFGSFIFMAEIDMAGNEVWKRNYRSEIVGVDGNSSAGIATDEDGTLILSSIAGDLHSEVSLIRIDTDGKEQWTKVYNGDNYEQARSLFRNANSITLLIETQGNGTVKNMLFKTKENGLITCDSLYDSTYDTLISPNVLTNWALAGGSLVLQENDAPEPVGLEIGDGLDTSVVCFSLGFNYLNSNSKYSIYPNPSNGKFTVSNLINYSQIELYNSNGSRVINESIQGVNSYELDLSEQSQGVYFLRVGKDDNWETSKVVLIH